MNGYLTPHWEHPVGTRCAYCGKPITITWTSSAVGHDIFYRTAMWDVSQRVDVVNEKMAN